jgi:hypothetical protein
MGQGLSRLPKIVAGTVAAHPQMQLRPGLKRPAGVAGMFEAAAHAPEIGRALNYAWHNPGSTALGLAAGAPGHLLGVDMLRSGARALEEGQGTRGALQAMGQNFPVLGPAWQSAVSAGSIASAPVVQDIGNLGWKGAAQAIPGHLASHFGNALSTALTGETTQERNLRQVMERDARRTAAQQTLGNQPQPQPQPLAGTVRPVDQAVVNTLAGGTPPAAAVAGPGAGGGAAAPIGPVAAPIGRPAAPIGRPAGPLPTIGTVTYRGAPVQGEFMPDETFLQASRGTLGPTREFQVNMPEGAYPTTGEEQLGQINQTIGAIMNRGGTAANSPQLRDMMGNANMMQQAMTAAKNAQAQMMQSQAMLAEAGNTAQKLAAERDMLKDPNMLALHMGLQGQTPQAINTLLQQSGLRNNEPITHENLPGLIAPGGQLARFSKVFGEALRGEMKDPARFALETNQLGFEEGMPSHHAVRLIANTAYSPQQWEEAYKRGPGYWFNPLGESQEDVARRQALMDRIKRLKEPAPSSLAGNPAA